MKNHQLIHCPRWQPATGNTQLHLARTSKLSCLLLLLVAALLLPPPGRGASISYTDYPNALQSSGLVPRNGLVLGNDGLTLYGTATAIATGADFIYSVKVDGTGFHELHQFSGSDGSLGAAVPIQKFSGNVGGLTLGKDGYLYGANPSGGASGAGNVYKIGVDGLGFQVIHNFTFESPVAPLVQGADGAFYGTGSGSTYQGNLFKLNPDGSGYAVLTLTNYIIWGGLIQGVDGLLYGTGEAVDGTDYLFVVTTNLTGFQTLGTVSPNPFSKPNGTLCQTPNGQLMGVAATLGVYLINTNGAGFQLVHAFGSIPGDGTAPRSGLKMGLDGWLYGTTYSGGIGEGTVYKIQPDGSSYTQVYQLASQPGNHAISPLAPVTLGSFQGPVGVLYGVSTGGGTSGGTFFSIQLYPPLSLAPASTATSGGQTTLTWPAWAASYQLQTTTNPATGPWVSVTNGTAIVGWQVPATNAGAFFRLTSAN